MEVRAGGAGEPVVACQCREPLEIAGADAAHGDLHGFAPCCAELAEQAAHPACRDLIAMRMREHRASARGPQRGDDRAERWP